LNVLGFPVPLMSVRREERAGVRDERSTYLIRRFLKTDEVGEHCLGRRLYAEALRVTASTHGQLLSTYKTDNILDGTTDRSHVLCVVFSIVFSCFLDHAVDASFL
jgi:hypothetical protein